MKTWIHWIGNQYYTPASFIKEAQKMGVSRRIAKPILKRMNWGDRVYLATKEPGRKNPVVFGWFEVKEILGIKTQDLPDEIKDKVKVVGEPGLMMIQERGCGKLVIGGCYAVTSATVEELADYADEPQITGGLKIFPRPWPVLHKMPPFRGFREFDSSRFLRDVLQNREKPRLRNFYYAPSPGE